ncbi:MAG TPA: AraC family transcriptional regulator [Gillisia sp.]|nr:AraC family transcriptional regulator [Gillisia sp.]
MSKTIDASLSKYLIANEQDSDWGLVITTTGHQEIEANTAYPPTEHPLPYLFSSEKGRTLNEYVLVYISRGKGHFVSTHQKKTQIMEGHMVLLFPNEWHNYSPSLETGWKESWIGFTGSNMEQRIAAGFFLKQNPIFNVGVHVDIVNLFKLAVKTAKEQKSGYQQMLAGIVNLLLGFSYSENRHRTFEDLHITDQINRAKVFMQENLASQISCEQIAEQIGMGYSWFRRRFKHYTGLAPKQYIEELKISEAKELLVSTVLPCKEIAFRLGFETPSYFSNVFKKNTGMPPKKYRDLMHS